MDLTSSIMVKVIQSDLIFAWEIMILNKPLRIPAFRIIIVIHLHILIAAAYNECKTYFSLAKSYCCNLWIIFLIQSSFRNTRPKSWYKTAKNAKVTNVEKEGCILAYFCCFITHSFDFDFDDKTNSKFPKIS